jgi:hypothetical protein
MATGRFTMAEKGFAARMRGQQNGRNSVPAEPREVPIQVMVPQSVRRQVALMSAERGENIRTLVLRGLRAVGIEIPDAELGDRRGRRRIERGGGNGAK